jgi:hypothetical protein
LLAQKGARFTNHCDSLQDSAMKHFLLFTLALAALAGVNTYAEQQTSMAPQDVLKESIQALNDAMIQADGKALRKLTANELSYGHSSGRVENQEEFINNLANGSSDFVSIDLQDQTISMVGNTAIVRHILSAKTNDSGKPGKVRIGVMLIWQKMDANWQLLARQAFKL